MRTALLKSLQPLCKKCTSENRTESKFFNRIVNETKNSKIKVIKQGMKNLINPRFLVKMIVI